MSAPVNLRSQSRLTWVENLCFQFFISKDNTTESVSGLLDTKYRVVCVHEEVVTCLVSRGLGFSLTFFPLYFHRTLLCQKITEAINYVATDL